MARTDDFDAISEHQHPHRGADEVIAVDERIGDQLLPDDAGHFGAAHGIEPLLPLQGAGVGADESQRLLEHIGQLAGDVSAVEVALILDFVAVKRHRLDDEGGQGVVRRLGEQQRACDIELPLVHQVHIGQQLGQGQVVLGERFTKLLLKERLEIRHVHIASPHPWHRGCVGMDQTGLLEQALDFLARRGAALVGAILHPDRPVLVHVGLADAFGNGDHQHRACGVGHVFSQRIHRGANVLRGRVGDEQVEAGNICAGEAVHRTIVVHAKEDAPTGGIAEGDDLRRQAVGIAHVQLELMAAVLATAEDVDQLCGFHRL